MEGGHGAPVSLPTGLRRPRSARRRRERIYIQHVAIGRSAALLQRSAHGVQRDDLQCRGQSNITIDPQNPLLIGALIHHMT